MTDTMNVPVAQPASGKSVGALVLGLLGLLMCPVFAPVAWYLGWAELRDIRAGLSAAAGQEYATIGMVLGIIGTVLIGLGLLILGMVLAFVLGVVGIAGTS